MSTKRKANTSSNVPSNQVRRSGRKKTKVAKGNSDVETKPPLGMFAMISDTQYVNTDDGQCFDGTRARRYRQSLQITSAACEHYRSSGKTYSFGIILGDVLDGKAGKLGIVDECFQDILRETAKLPIPWHFLVGNHDLYVFSREEILQRYVPPIDATKHCTPTQLYYDFTCPGMDKIRFVVLDAFECSFMGAASEALTEQAIEYIKRNPNMIYDVEKKSWPTGDWLEGIEPELRMFTPFGGAIGSAQLQWLDDTLKRSSDAGERCIIFSHLPVYRECTYYVECCMFNCDEVLAVLHRYPGTVVAYFAGHDHTGGYAIDDHGIHHVIPPAPVDCALGDLAYGEVSVFSDHLRLDWWGSPPPDFALANPWPTRLEFASSSVTSFTS